MKAGGERARALELWAGVECTVNRVGHGYFDQLRQNGHETRLDDLDRILALGARAVRYPVLWERTAPEGLARADWSWADERLRGLAARGMRPIVGLVHHGSGPRHTCLIEPGFADGLAEFAQAVAERYPWVEDYTPVNEPMTTARFSGLYGLWYPHRRDDRSFVRALLTQCRATVLAMRAVRAVNPSARLVQTEDFGTTTSTPALAYQAEHENQRRLLGLDLLVGRVDGRHPLYEYLVEHGAKPEELAFFREAPCPPDIIGINYYVTSDRFLDDRLEGYPRCHHGGNGRHVYADVETVRISGHAITGHHALLSRLWERYRIPLVITEAHLGGTRDEQLRWFVWAWRGAERARAEGVDVRAVTMWSLFGSFNWDCLVTCEGDHYEPGAFDVRGPAPRPTALVALGRALSEGREPDHPVLATPGWWLRPDRVLYPASAGPRVESVNAETRETRARPLLITGATGTLGGAFGRACTARAIPYRLVSRREMDIADPEAVERMLAALSPWAVINTAGYVRVDDAERDPHRCERENVLGPSVLARACRERTIRLVTFSSDLVFDGARREPYVESDPVSPLGVYGQSKALAERLSLSACPETLVIRTAAFFGPWDEHNFVFQALRALAQGESFVAASDLVISPTYVPDLVGTALDLLVDGESGIWHLTNRGAVTWFELARQSADLAGIDRSGLVGCPASRLGLAAPRPPYCALGSERGILLPGLEDALARYTNERAIPIAGGGIARGRDPCASF
ncbi:family 1 glycosylhydrolase [Polyangium sp. y55x31]|uniref:family 1 glycosylhydrolase n=1 Tax=Polyangium sp. y55x31 TaxID=3042688 RepID=UPI0024821D43|nr:family 1 glycosylhydrolase [Polyangium sp. y55x31]MDI1475913.1 family 1 glycosylhydrolase [Polyangium sp. y55x31]